MRGGLDDALEKLARRDELRRRAAGEATGTPPAVTELVEAIAAVVGRNPELGVTVGVEGAGDPMLLHFYSEDGVVQVNADTAIAGRAGEQDSGAHRHADIDIDIEIGEPIEEPYSAPPAYSPVGHEPGAETRRLSQDDQDRYGPATFGYPEPDDRYYGESETAERRYGSFDNPPEERYAGHDPGEISRDLGARMRDLGMATRESAPPSPPSQPQPYPPHPFAPTPPPPVPPQTTRRIQSEQYHSPAEPSAAERAPQQYEPVGVPPQPERRAPEQRGGMPTLLPKPIPLHIERPEETEIAARRLAALLRDDPSLLNQRPE